jgi:Tol biopolymer transport system component
MRYFSGGSLADVLERQKRLPAEVAVALADQIAAALDYAHSQGVIHRDLKPSNILFDAQGNAYVSDFGLNWLLEASGNVSGTGVVGSPAYMSPEIAAGQREVGPAIDIYALGVILFESLTGQPPFKAANPLKLAMMHLNDTPPSPGSLNPNLPRAVDAVILKALAKKPEDRFATAGELAQALGDAAAIGPGPHVTVNLGGVLGVAEASTQQISGDDLAGEARPARRANEWLAFSAIATLLALGILVAGGFFLGGLLNRGAASPTPPEVAATQPSGPATLTPSGGSPGPTAAATRLPTPSPVPGVIGGGGGKIAYISARSGNPELYILNITSSALTQVTHNTGAISQPAWSPDGKRLAFVSDQGKDNPHIFVVDADGQNPKDVTPADRAYGYPLWLPDAHSLAYFVLEGEDRVLRKVDVNGGDSVDVVRVPSSFKTLLDWTPDNHVIYYGFSRAGNLAVVNVDTANADRSPITVSGNVPFLSYSPDRTKVAFTLMSGRQSQLFLADTSCPLLDQCNARRLVNDNASYTTPRFSPDGKLLLVASDRGGNFDLVLLDLDGKLVQKLPGSGLDDTDGVWDP